MKIKNRSPLILLALALSALAFAPPCRAQTAVRLSPHSVSTYDPLRGTCTITSDDDAFEATRPEADATAGDGGMLAGILVAGDAQTAAAATVVPDSTASAAAALAAPRAKDRPAYNARHRRTGGKARRAHDTSTTTARSHDPTPARERLAGNVACYLGSVSDDALLPADTRRGLTPNPEPRGERRDLRHTVRASSHPEDKTDPYASEKPAFEVRI
jgi:hypothetical protein